MAVGGLESNEVDFKVDAGPDREPVEISDIYYITHIYIIYICMSIINTEY